MLKQVQHDNDRHFKKILVIRFSSLGDVILTTPLLKRLRSKFPKSEIHFCAYSSYSDILKNNPNINRLITIKDKPSFAELRKLKDEIKRGRYTLILDAHNNLRTFYLKLFMPGKVKSFKKYSLRKFLLVKFKINLMKDLPGIAQRQLSMVNYQLSMVNEDCIPEIFIDEDSKRNVDKILNEAGAGGEKKLICIVVGAGHFTKTYPAEYFEELIGKFEEERYDFILVGKGKDKENIHVIKKETGENVFNLCDKLNLQETAELMKRCSLVITGDTGPMHIAEAAGVPISMIAGSSVREFGFFPTTENSVEVENVGLPCRPCSHIGRDSCPLGHFKCMRELKPEIVYEKVISLINA